MIVAILSAMVAALIGTAVGAFVLLRRIRPPVTEAQLEALKNSQRAAESALVAASAEVESLRRQIAELERTIQKCGDELNEKQRQLDAAAAEAANQTTQLSAAGEEVQQLSAEVVALKEQRATLQATLQEENHRVAEQADQQVALYEARLDAERQRIEDLAKEVARLTAECADVKAQLSAELERSRQLAAALESDRESAAKGIELLLMAQENLSRLLKPACEESPHCIDMSERFDTAGTLANDMQPVCAAN